MRVSVAYTLSLPAISAAFGSIVDILELWQKRNQKNRNEKFYKHCLTALFDIIGETHFPLGI